MAEVVCETYALALLETACEDNLQLEICNELNEVLNLFKKNPDYFNIFLSPAVDKEEKKRMLHDVFSNEINSYVLNLLYLLADNKRFAYFEGIVNAYSDALLKMENIVDVTAVTAVRMPDELSEKLKDKLSLMLNKTVRLKNEVDKSIIGGVIIRYDNKEIDNSVKARLDGLKKNIKSYNI